MQRALWLVLLFSFLGISDGLTQQLDHVLGEVLIKLKTKTDIYQFQNKARYHTQNQTDFSISAPDNPLLGIYVGQFDPNRTHEIDFLQWLRAQPEVEMAQFNHILDWRSTTPNDPLFSEQWQYLNLGNNGGLPGFDLDADLAWDISTGGNTLDGDTIVVAVIDNGVYPDHPDFERNLWINYQEIPNNGIDDDENGYIDDYRGWNILKQSDDIYPTGINGHGTAVAGTIGARGNNLIGVSGINWKIKMMIISNKEIFTEARALQSYAYCLKMRKLYNQTDGKKGAYIVSTNASWGKDFSFPEDAPIWCEMYDQLGEAGILNCGATTNFDVDVDAVGDLPTTCPSDFLIAVTNLNNRGEKVVNAGRGVLNIDIASFGENAFTTTQSNTLYQAFKGTSSATPQVTGAIALLYASPCNDLVNLSKTNPAAAALKARAYILNGVELNTSLSGKIATEGQLNLYKSLKLALDDCGSCPSPDQTTAETLNNGTVSLDWRLPYYGQNSSLRYRIKNTNSWIELQNISPPYTLAGLQTCTDYEWEIKVSCGNEDSEFSNTAEFNSGQCCYPPTAINIQDSNNSSLTLEWLATPSADSYLVNYKSADSVDWKQITVDDPILPLGNLEICQDYLLQIQPNCPLLNGQGFSEILSFKTKGCGNCLDQDYCIPDSGDDTYEWIQSFKINDLEQSSGSSNGYENFTNNSTVLTTYKSYDVEINPGFPGIPNSEHYRIWIDYNQDGDFWDLEELVFRSDKAPAGLQKASIDISPAAFEGTTRMRVGLFYDQPGNFHFCDTEYFGEIEDYCISIEKGNANCDQPTNLDTLETATNSVWVSWDDLTDDHQTHNLRYRLITDTTMWTEIKDVDAPFLLDPLEPCNTYLIQVEAICTSDGISGYGPALEFSTQCNSGFSNRPGISNLKISPNLFQDQVNASFFLEQASPIEIRIFAVDGKLLYQKGLPKLNSGEHQLEIIDLDFLPEGLFFLQFSCQTAAASQRVVKY